MLSKSLVNDTLPEALKYCFVPTLRIFLQLAIGALVCKYKFLTREVIDEIGKFTLNLLMPLFLFVSLGSSVEAAGLLAIFRDIFLNMIFVHGTGFMLGLIASKISRCPPFFKNNIICGVLVGNNFVLPLTLLKGQCETYGVLAGQNCNDIPFYVVIYVTLSNFIIPLLGPYLYQRDAKLGKEYQEYSLKGHEKLLPSKEANEIQASQIGLAYVDSINKGMTMKAMNKMNFMEYLMALLIRMSKSGSFIATIAGLICGLIPWTNYMLFDHDSFFKVVTDVMKFMGDMNIPLSNLTLGYTLYHISENKRLLGLSTFDLIMVTFAKMFLLPLFGIAIIMSLRFTLGGDYENIVFAFTQYFQWCTPSAMNILFFSLKSGQGSDEVSEIILYQMMISAISITWNSSLFSYVYLMDMSYFA